MTAYSHFALVYFNGENPPLPFKVTEETPLAYLISKLRTLLRFLENCRVVKLKYHSPSFDSDENIQFTNFELKTDEDLKVMWSVFHRYESKGPIEADARFKDLLRI